MTFHLGLNTPDPYYERQGILDIKIIYSPSPPFNTHENVNYGLIYSFNNIFLRSEVCAKTLHTKNCRNVCMYVIMFGTWYLY